MTYQPPAPKVHNINVKLSSELHAELQAAFPSNLSHGVRHIIQKYLAEERRRASRNRKS